ncbi:MAG: hypothetical protein QXJ69_02740 [Desulfurococcaceae archaeon]
MIEFNIREKIKLFLERYGEKGLIILKAAYDISQDPNIDHRLGDFSYKHLALKLASLGFSYNPINMLRILEKDYGIIEKSYSSSNQSWWRFIDIEAVRSALGEYYGASIEDPRVRLLLIKYKSIEPWSTLEMLRRLAFKENLTNSDKENFKNFVFNNLDKIVELLNNMEKYEEVFAGEISVLREILNLADLVSSKIEKPRSRISSYNIGALVDVNTRNNFYKNTSIRERDLSS